MGVDVHPERIFRLPGGRGAGAAGELEKEAGERREQGAAHSRPPAPGTPGSRSHCCSSVAIGGSTTRATPSRISNSVP